MDTSKKFAKILKVIIYVMMFFLAGMLYIWIGKFMNNNIKGIEFFYNLVLAGSFLFVLFFAKKIMDSIINNLPFSKENINYFKYIGYTILFIAFLDLVLNIQNFTGKLVISFQPFFAIHFSFLFYLSFGLLSIILSEIFNKAYKLKEETEINIKR